jgi:hypothetical protein
LNRIIRIVTLTALIAVTLGMTNLSAVLGGKPTYSVKVELLCGPNMSATVQISFWKWDAKQVEVGSVVVSCTDASVGTQTVEVTQIPNMFVGHMWQFNAQYPPTNGYCSGGQGGIVPDADLWQSYLTCISPSDGQWHTVNLYIYAPTKA